MSITEQTTSTTRPSRRIAYLTSRFPKITETFILYEIVELERLGMQVEVFPLIREQEAVVHAEAQAVIDRAHYSTAFSRPVLAAQAYWLRRRPLAYLGAWARAIIGNIKSPKFLIRALVVVPQAAWFAQQARELGVEHIHAHWATHPALAAFVVKQVAGIPYSFTAHAHDLYVERPMLGEKLRAASFVVTISEYNRNLLHEWYGELADNVSVIHCGVDLEVFKPRPERPQGDPLVIACVASLQDYKGHRYLIEACANLKASGRNFQCLLIGDGELRPDIEAQIAQLGLQHEVKLLGHQPRDRVSTLLAKADVMVLPSVVTANGKREGIPVALMEALATELPVVATAISGIPELIVDNQTGLLVPERNAEALAKALQRLCDEPTLGRTLGVAGRERVMREFNLRENVAALFALLGRDWTDTAPQAERVPGTGYRVRQANTTES